ncbi:hypothetical protein ACFL3V_04240 [Nanoarchaeota archaeon]
MVIHESYITRKPLEFTLIVLTIVLVLLLPVYLFTKHNLKGDLLQEDIIAESFEEANFMFGPESELSEKDKKHLFVMKYEGNFVQWSGKLSTCDSLGAMFRVGVDHTGNGFSDVLFTTFDDCRVGAEGGMVTYKMRVVDWKVNRFIGKDGRLVKWG